MMLQRRPKSLNLNLAGEELSVSVQLATHTYPHGVDWESLYSDENNPRTRALKRRLAQEVAQLSMLATNNTLTGFT